MWHRLNKTLGGRLFRSDQGLPQAAIFSTPASMEKLDNGRWNPLWIQNQSELAQNTGGGGARGWSMAVSTYVVKAECARDISLAVKFAAKHNLRLVVKGAGHDYLGRSTAPNSLLIWTGRLQGIKWDRLNRTVTVEAGVIWQDVYTQAQERGRHAVGGSCPTVGAAGGFPLGGGFGEAGFSRREGMAAQNMLRATVVTASGKVVEASPASHPRLFWALRGGGGGTFGVVFDITYRTAEMPRLGGRVRVGLIIPEADEASWSAFTERWIAFVNTSLLTRHWGGSWYPGRTNLRPPYDDSLWFVPQFLFWDIPYAEAQSLFSNFQASLASDVACFSQDCLFYYEIYMAPNMTLHGENFTKLYPDFLYSPVIYTGRPGQFIDENYVKFTSYQHWIFYFSVFVPMGLYADPPALAKKLGRIMQLASPQSLYLSTGKSMGGDVYNSDRASNSINTHAFESGSLIIQALQLHGYWRGREPTLEALQLFWARNADLLTAIEAGVPSITPLPTECKAAEGLTQQEVTQCWQAVGQWVDKVSDIGTAQAAALRESFPDTGAYASEADYYEPNWQRQFWGDNYFELYRIKQKYDPKGLFVCHHCVGSEDWSEDGNCYVPPQGGH